MLYTVETRTVGTVWEARTENVNATVAYFTSKTFRTFAGVMVRLVRQSRDNRRANRQVKRRLSPYAMLVQHATDAQRSKLDAARAAGVPMTRLARLARLLNVAS